MTAVTVIGVKGISLATIAGGALIAIGLLLYVISIALAVGRVGGQYSRAMPGSRGLRVAAAMAAASRRWFFLAIAVIGVVVVLLAR